MMGQAADAAATDTAPGEAHVLVVGALDGGGALERDLGEWDGSKQRGGREHRQRDGSNEAASHSLANTHKSDDDSERGGLPTARNTVSTMLSKHIVHTVPSAGETTFFGIRRKKSTL